jgi:hypothetical protein
MTRLWARCVSGYLSGSALQGQSSLTLLSFWALLRQIFKEGRGQGEQSVDFHYYEPFSFSLACDSDYLIKDLEVAYYRLGIKRPDCFRIETRLAT